MIELLNPMTLEVDDRNRRLLMLDAICLASVGKISFVLGCTVVNNDDSCGTGSESLGVVS